MYTYLISTLYDGEYEENSDLPPEEYSKMIYSKTVPYYIVHDVDGSIAILPKEQIEIIRVK